MADLARIKRNVAKMVGMGAPEADIDAYIGQEGVTIDQVRAYKGEPIKIAGKVTPQTSVPGPSSNVEIAPQAPQAAPPVNLASATAATLNGITGSVPFLNNISDAIMGAGSQLMGGSYADTVAGLQRRRQELAQQAPLSAIAGNVAGVLAPFGAASKSKVLADALGMGEGNLLQRAGNFGLSGAGYAGLQGESHGQDQASVLSDMMLGGATAAPIPLAGAALRAGSEAAWNAVAPKIGAAFNPVKEAARRGGSAFVRDQRAGDVVTAADEQVAAEAGIPLLNADRGGETTRALARSVANQSPEARSAINKVADERFRGQSDRAVNFIKQLTGNRVDDIARRAAILDTGRTVNEAAYRRAEAAPGAQAIWTPELGQLMQSPDFMQAIKEAERTAANDAAIRGGKAVRNPFVFDKNGDVGLRRQPDGSVALPNLQFWDIVQRNLRKAAEGLPVTAKSDKADLGELRRQLLSVLDNAVPEFQAARQGAAGFFGAENALDAGRQFATQPRMLPEARQAFMKFNGTERRDFATGYASSIIDRIKSANDGQNVIRAVFESPASREMMEMVFGKAKFRNLEAYVRVENLADRLRGSLGNSTTARQLVELGIGAGAGGFATNWDLKGIAAGALAARGARFVGQRVDNQVMQEVAKLLLSGTRADLDRAIANARMSDQWMAALAQLSRLIEGPASRALAVGQ